MDTKTKLNDAIEAADFEAELMRAAIDAGYSEAEAKDLIDGDARWVPHTLSMPYGFWMGL